MKNLLKWTIKQATTNKALTGAIATSVVSGAWALANQIPNKLYTQAKNQFIATMEVVSSDPLFPHMEKWLFKKLGKVRKMRLIGQYDHRKSYSDNLVDEDGDNHQKVKHYFAPDNGKYWFWHEGRLFSVVRGRDGDEESGSEHDEYGKRFEYITFTTLSRDPDVFKSIVEDASQTANKRETLPFYVRSMYGWEQVNTLFPRSINTIYIPDEQKVKLISDIKWFFANKQWYRDRHIPYRRGYLFSGPPGTGKSSFVVALATLFDLPLFVINLGSIGTDEALIKVMQSVPPKSIVLIEDIDAALISASTNRKEDKNKSPLVSSEGKKIGFSLSSFLNAIDGIFATDERILIMTTNYAEDLDPAVIRPGRVDLHLRFSKIGLAEIKTMISNFYEDEVKVPSCGPVLPAELQQQLIDSPFDPKPVVDWLKKQKVK